MKCSVFIATSMDGYIAKKDDSIDWLHTAGNGKVLKGKNADMGFKDYISSVDCMVMGRKTMDVISSMDLLIEQWPYGNIKIIVLSNSIKVAPKNLAEKVEMYSGDLVELINKLEQDGYKHAYIDGGTTIQAFINLQLINELTITKVPILLGDGIPLFGKNDSVINLEEGEAIAFPNDFIQIKYKLRYT